MTRFFISNQVENGLTNVKNDLKVKQIAKLLKTEFLEIAKQLLSNFYPLKREFAKQP